MKEDNSMTMRPADRAIPRPSSLRTAPDRAISPAVHESGLFSMIVPPVATKRHAQRVFRRSTAPSTGGLQNSVASSASRIDGFSLPVVLLLRLGWQWNCSPTPLLDVRVVNLLCRDEFWVKRKHFIVHPFRFCEAAQRIVGHAHSCRKSLFLRR